jgi:hypothetical protein
MPTDLEPPAMGFQLVSADIQLAAGEETTKCWYFEAPNNVDLAVTRWESQMTPGSHHMIVFFTNSAQQPHGTITDECGITGGGGAVWSYSAQEPYADQQLPAGVGVGVRTAQAGFIQMHYLNASDGPLTAHVTLNVHTYAEGAQYIPAAPLITFHAGISIPPMSTASVSDTCTVPAGAQFYSLGMHAHKQAVHMETRQDSPSGTLVFETDSWSEPGGEEWLAEPFYTFPNNQLYYRCDYNNPTNRTITTGDSAATDEMCMSVGYMFPASQPTLCLGF